MTGSFCTLGSMFDVMEQLAENNSLIPIVSEAVAKTDTRFGTAKDNLERIRQITQSYPITTIAEAEPLGPQKKLDIIVAAPCTGNTLAKLAHGITDTPVLMAIKAHIRNDRPVVLAIYTNDALSNNAVNIGLLLNKKNIFIVPFYQDDHEKKPRSINSDTSLIIPTMEYALEGVQLQPIIKGGL